MESNLDRVKNYKKCSLFGLITIHPEELKTTKIPRELNA